MSARAGGKELAGLVPHPLFNQLYRSGLLDRFTPAQTSFPLIRPSPSFFSPLSPIGRRGFALYPLCTLLSVRAIGSCRTLMRHPGIPASLPVRFTFLDPASLCGVTQRKCRRCYRAEVARAAPSSGAAELSTLKQSSPSFLLRLARSLPDKGGILATLLFLP